VNRIDLFQITAPEVLDLVYAETDPKIIGYLQDLHQAKCDGDVEAEVEAIGELADLLILEKGAWS
jgi:hypothetical protein